MERHERDEERRDWRAALVCSTLYNLYRDPKKRPEPFTPWDIIPRREALEEPETEMSPDQALAHVRGLAAQLGARTVE
jgi:hypothetical protein